MIDAAKKYLKWLVVGGGVALAALAVPGDSDVSMEKLTEKYEQTPQIQEKYYQVGGSLILKEGSDKVGVELGNATNEDFVPEMKMDRWLGEVSLKIKPDLSDVDQKDKTLTFENDKVKFGTPKVEYAMYELPDSPEYPEGAFEYEIILKEKPASNVITLDIETENLDFFYQPELTQAQKNRGDFQPENVINSYAVYYQKPVQNIIGRTDYKTGKAFHIYRPKIKDDLSREIWGELNITTGTLSITIDQDWLDNALYPVSVDPSFGYVTGGVSSSNTLVNNLRGSVFTAPDFNATITSISMFVAESGVGSQNAKGVIILKSNDTMVTNGTSSAARSITGTTGLWYRDNVFSAVPTLSASTDYILAAISDESAFLIYWDSGSTNQGYWATSSYANLTDPTQVTYFDLMYSLYLTYAGEAGDTLVLDATSTSGIITESSTYSFVHTNTTTGSNLFLAVGVGTVSLNCVTITSVAYNGVAMVSQGEMSLNITQCVNNEIFTLVNPATGANTVNVVLQGKASTSFAGAISFAGAAQTGNPEATTTDGSLDSSPQLSVTTKTKYAWVFGTNAMRAVTTQVSANQVRWQANVTDSYGGATANGSINPTSTILMKWTSGSTRTWAAGAISIKPAGVGSTYTPIIIKPGVIFKNNVIFK